MNKGRLIMIAAVAMAALPASAYYHYVRYQTRTAPFTPAYARFDLRSLPDQTVTVSVDVSSMQGNSTSAAPVLGQLRHAASVWNAIPASELRIAFGGIKSNDVAASAPEIDVVFTNDLPPGFLAAAAPTVSETPVTAADGAVFYPIVGSVMSLKADTNRPPGPAYAETYFTTLVHELGHALGLQHTFTASAMSQQVIRATTYARPIAPDDVAALLTLYGRSGWRAAYGSVAGRVMMDGQPVSRASVVALPPNGSPVSALTNPDGTYRIDGVPPGQFLLYVHPLPPNADITPPVDGANEEFPASGPFETVFYPGTREYWKVAPITVKAGETIEAKDFFVSPRAAVSAYDLITYSFFDAERQAYSWFGQPVTPAFLNIAKTYPLAQAAIVVKSRSGDTPIPVGAKALTGLNEPYYIGACCGQAALYFAVTVFTNPGSQHLILNFQDDMYVLPNGVQLVAKNPPAISALEPGENGTVTVSGSNLAPGSRVLFDGVESSVRGFDSEKSALTVTPPPGYSGQMAAVTVANPDGQNSMTLDSYELANGLALKYPPPSYAYPETGQPWIEVSPRSLPAGSIAKVEITGHNMQFVEGQVSVGFGTGDVVIRRAWVVSPDKIVLDVAVASNARTGASDISVISGFQVAAEPLAFQIISADSDSPVISAVSNAVPGQATIYPGGYVSVSGSRLAFPDGTPQVTLDGVAIRVEYSSPSQVTFAVPYGLPAGPLTLVLSDGSRSALPVVIQIALPPPSIVKVTSYAGYAIGPDRPAGKGDVLRIVLAGLDPTAASDLARIRVTLGNVRLGVVRVAPQDDGLFELLALLPNVPADSIAPLAVWVDGSSAAAVAIPIQHPLSVQP